jgi:HSP20 family molecular chaperone IbpA
MFNKKTCQRCGRKTSKGDSFCPTCGTPLKKSRRKEDLGMLGEDDCFEEIDSISNSLFGKIGGFGGLGGGFMNNMISNTMKMLEKEMQREMQKENKVQNQNNENMPRTKIKLIINGKEINLNGMNNGFKEGPREEKHKEKVIKFNRFSEEQAKKFSKLPKKEPKTELKRIADKISYEIEIPGVNSFEDVSVLPLEKSIEVKAIAKENSYSKSIPLNLPIIDYVFSRGLLILEFKGN